MTDFQQLESGIEINGVYQRVVDVFCYIDIPIPTVIGKLELIDKENNFFKFINSCSPVIIGWLKSNPDKTFEIPDYINFLQTHMETTRDFVRFGLSSVQGIYVKISKINEEFIGLDENYIEWYNRLVSDFDLVMEPIPVGTDLRVIPSTQIRPTLKWSEKTDESIKTIFAQTSFQCTP